MYSLFLIHKKGIIFRWFSEYLGHKVEANEILTKAKIFFLVHGEQYWGHQRINFLQWADIEVHQKT